MSFITITRTIEYCIYLLNNIVCYNINTHCILFQLATVTITQVCAFLIRQSMNKMTELVEVFVLTACIIQLDGNVKNVQPTSITIQECPLVTQPPVFVSILCRMILSMSYNVYVYLILQLRKGNL